MERRDGPRVGQAAAVTEPTGSSRRRLRVPAVLRDEPQYRLLFTGQVLSILGDRVTGVVLPFAVLAVGGDVGDVAIVSAAQFLPFAVLALPGRRVGRPATTAS